MTTATPVLVVGGRTTGLMMAAELARHGVGVRIVDKSPGIDPHSRATVLHSRTLEILHSLGLAEELIDGAQMLHGMCIYANGQFIGRSEEEDVDSPFPRSMARSQATTERILQEHLESFGVYVERCTTLTALEQTDDLVRATLENADGRIETLTTPWLIGCDGAHSTVRDLVEESFPGVADPYPYVLADVIVEGPHDPGDAYIFLSDQGEFFLFILDEGRRLVVATAPRGSDMTVEPTLDEMQRIATERSGLDLRLRDPRWLTHFHICYRLVPHYRRGRVFLAGDAAHVHSPVGGHGMNIGMQDAHNLAWKLALVTRHAVPESWLDTYATERRRIAEDMLAMTRHVTVRSELFAGISPQYRERLLKHMFVPEGEMARARRQMEEIDHDYRSSPICVEPPGEFTAGPHAGARAADGSPLVVDGRECTCFDLLRGTRHCLLLFAGATNRVPPVELARAARGVLESHGDWIRAFVIVAGRAPRDLPGKVTIVEDAQGALHERYGAQGPSLYLIRPDGHVAYRSRRVDSLEEYFTRVL